jgi:hypothetical protein
VALARGVAAAWGSGASWDAMERLVDHRNGAGALGRMSLDRRRNLGRRVATVALNFSAVMAEPVALAA